MKEDSSKVNALLYLGEKNCSIENDKALMYLQEAYTIAASQKYKKGIGKSLLWQGRVYYYKDDYPLALKYLSKAKRYFKESKNENDLAFTYFAEGEIYKIRGDYLQALEAYDIALKYADSCQNKKFISSYLGCIGGVHLKRNEPEKAMPYFKDALRQKKAIGDLQGMSNSLTSIGKAFEEMNAPDSALWYYNEALKIRVGLNNTRTIAGSKYNIGGILIKLGAYEEAEEALSVALENFSSLDEKTGMIIANLSMAEARNYLNKPDAIEIAEKALQMAKSIDNPSLISHCYHVLSDIYYLQDKFKLSHDYFEMHKALEDSIFNVEKERMLTEFEEKFQSERKDREIEFYISENKIQDQNILLLAVLLVAAFGFVLLLFFLFRMKSTALKRQGKLLEQEQIIHQQENKLSEKENQLLQEQLEAKTRELASKALEMLRLNDTISSIIEKLEKFNHAVNDNPSASKNIKDIIHELETQTKQNIWNEFDKIFKNIHSDFYSKLLAISPDLSATEIKTAALLKLNLTTKEIAALTFKSEGGIKTTRYRLRQKLALGSDDKLIPFLMQL